MVARANNEAWLGSLEEEVLEPDLPICDPHHHLWDLRRGALQERYLLDEILADVGSGHNVVSTVFIECGAMFKASGPSALNMAPHSIKTVETTLCPLPTSARISSRR